MTSTATLLDTMVHERLHTGGFLVQGGRDLFMEVMDTTTGLVWMSAAPVTLTDFRMLELAAPLVKVGVAPASMDSAAFHSSPGAPGEPVLQRVIDGRLYINVAAPAPPEQWIASALPGGPTELLVNKSHVIGFEGGRSVAVMSLPQGDFVELVGEAEADDTLVLPPGGTLRRVFLDQPWVVELPNPTSAFFWFGPAMRSFQGPVTVPN
ncbi:MAG: hypothetical protein R3E64_17920 [Halioglobus sp.]